MKLYFVEEKCISSNKNILIKSCSISATLCIGQFFPSLSSLDTLGLKEFFKPLCCDSNNFCCERYKMQIRTKLMNEMKTVGATYPLFMRLIIIKSSHFMTRGVNRMNIIGIKITFKNEFKKSK